jgi:hypothetical protein
VKRVHESTYLKAQKMMRGRMAPYVVPIVVRAMPLMVKVVKYIVTIP